METITINFKELTDAIAKLEEDHPSRMHGHIDLLRTNLKYNLTQFLSSNILTVELDDKTKTAFIGGKPITGDVYALYNTNEKEPAISEKMYEQIQKAKKEAERLGIYERVFGKVEETKIVEDESLLNKNPQEVQDYLNDLAVAVCIKGERLEKYEKMAIKRCGNEAYANMKLFVEEVQRSVERGKFTNTSKVNLSYLGKNAGLSESVVIKITKYFEDEFAEKDREEDNLWNQCYPGYKPGYQNYLNRYPNGKYASTARSIIADLERKEKDEAKERAEREERNFWNNCQTSDKSGFLKYLDKYPNGKYASTARSIIADLDRKQKEKEEREQREQKAEQQMWDQCRTKDDYQRYLDRYPYGVYASKAYVEMLKAEKEEKRQKEEAAKARFAKEREERERAAEQALWNKCQTKEEIAHLDKINRRFGGDNNKNTDSGSKVTFGNNKKNNKASLKKTLALLVSAIVLYAVAYLIRDECENLGPFLCLVSFFPYMLFAYEVVNNKKLGIAICITGWFVMMFCWSDYVKQPTQSILPALGILGICSFFAVVAYFSMYQKEP